MLVNAGLICIATGYLRNAHIAALMLAKASNFSPGLKSGSGVRSVLRSHAKVFLVVTGYRWLIWILARHLATLSEPFDEASTAPPRWKAKAMVMAGPLLNVHKLLASPDVLITDYLSY